MWEPEIDEQMYPLPGPKRMISIRIPAVPVAQPRARATIKGGHASMYNPKGPVDAFKACVRLAVAEAYKWPPVEGPVRVDITFIMPRTQSQIWVRKPMPRLWHYKKPDRDNLDKSVLDALTGLLWRDDCQVCDGRIRKLIASGDEQPGVIIVVKELEE